eukprot:COSAG06_NODE_1864_length_8194_cov_4.258431_9_plen_42_part_00
MGGRGIGIAGAREPAHKGSRLMADTMSLVCPDPTVTLVWPV